MVEYGLLVALLAVILITASQAFVTAMANSFTHAGTTINDSWSGR